VRYFRAIFFSLVATLSVAVLLFTEVALTEEKGPYTYKSKNRRDPFVPLIIDEIRTYTSLETIETVDDLMLEGILWDPDGGSIAILNGAILKRGDKVKNVKILEIAPTKVRLMIYNDEFELNLQEEEKEEKR